MLLTWGDQLPDNVSPIPAGDHMLVNSGTYKQFKWGGSGHREVLHLYAPVLASMAAEAIGDGMIERQLTGPEVASVRDEWDSLPFAVPRIEPREGHVYVTSESNESVLVGSETYCRIFISEGVVPKQVGSPVASPKARFGGAAAMCRERLRNPTEKESAAGATPGDGLSAPDTHRRSAWPRTRPRSSPSGSTSATTRTRASSLARPHLSV